MDYSNPAKLSGSGGIFARAGFGKSVGFCPDPEPKSSTALMKIDGSTKVCPFALDIVFVYLMGSLGK